MDDVVPMQDRNQRSKQLRNLSEKKKRRFYADNINREATVLFENDVENGLMQGFTENYIRVITEFNESKVNQLSTIKMSKLNFEGLMEVKELTSVSY